MDKQKRKEAAVAWKNRKPEMGVIACRCAPTGDVFLIPASDIPADTNSLQFRLSAGLGPNRQLQDLWKQYGKDAFSFDVAQRLDYNDPTENHDDELETLLTLCLLENPGAVRV